MKRLLSALLGAAMVLSASVSLLAVSASAASSLSQGDIVEKGDDYYDDVVTTLTPGKTYYIAIAPYDREVDLDLRSSARSHLEAIGVSNDRKMSLGNSLSISRRKVSGSEYWYFATLNLKEISAGSYSEDGYDLSGYIDVGGDIGDIDVNASIEYEEGGGYLEETPRYFIFDDEEDIELDLPDDNGVLVINSRGVKSRYLLAMNTDYNSAIGERFPNANLNFYNGNGAAFKRTCKLILDAESNEFLYEYSDGQLIDRTSSYHKSENAFVLNIQKLGTYIISDRKLSGAVSGNSSSSSQTSNNNTNTNTNTNNTVTPTTPPADDAAAGRQNVMNLVSTYFTNKFVVVNYGTSYGSIGKTVGLQCKPDLTGFNTANLKVYAYDAAKNQFLIQNNASPKVVDGTLYFNSSVTGYYVISEGALAFRQ